jgi:tRNA-intron endonuclease, archaea type
MPPYLKDDKVIVSDKKLASTMYNKGCFGNPVSGGGSELSLIEAAYLLEHERTEVRRSRKGRNAELAFVLKRGVSKDPRFMENYLVFRDIRNRGLVVQGSEKNCFVTYPRGKRPGNGKADAWISVQREDDICTSKDLWLEAKKRFNMRMNSIVAVVDSDWDITYYLVKNAIEEKDEKRFKVPTLSETVEKLDLPHGGALMHSGPVSKIRSEDFIGTDLGGNTLVSPEEDMYLNRKINDESEPKLKVYMDLKDRGWFVRTGFKYGAHFRVYTDRSLEEHSKFLVHQIDEKKKFTWEELSRPLRLSHSVRKRFLFAFFPSGLSEPHYTGSGPVYLEMEWVRL